MLIFFKPWCHASDLRANGQSWENAFQAFRENCSRRIIFIMDNMQILHECKDSRDDHFAQCRACRKEHTVSYHRNRHDTDDFADEENTEEAILDHLRALDLIASDRQVVAKAVVDNCLRYADRAGLFRERPAQFVPGTYNRATEGRTECVDLAAPGLPLEKVWKETYDQQKVNWKKSSMYSSSSSASAESINERTDVPHGKQSSISDGSAFRDALVSPLTNIPTIRQDIPVSAPVHHVDIDTIIAQYTLNTEQARAFRIIAQHSLLSKPEVLRMLLSGPGGTGKSTVISALTHFFNARGQSRRFRLASYTSIAARNIQGMTLHSALMLGKMNRRGESTKTMHELVAMWQGVDYLFIDEISMVGCKLLFDVSTALSIAKEDSSIFGGINLIVTGDFVQLPPVRDRKLYGSITRYSTSKLSQDQVQGKLLWLSIDTVIVLHEVWRQRGSENIPFVELLSRLRTGTCTEADRQLLSTCLLSNVKPDWTDKTWASTPLVVPQNNVKDAFNERMAHCFAQEHGRELHYYHSVDVHKGLPVIDHGLQDYLHSLSSGNTNQRLGALPLVIGMPVMISTNVDVPGGVVNGSIGTLEKIRYRVDEEGRRYALSCAVKVPHMTGDVLPELHEQEAAVVADDVDMEFTHPYSQRRCRIKRTQVPVMPVFAFTAHKAQGQTMDTVLVDLKACRGTESPYVMVSRVKSLSGLLILRPFDLSVIQKNPSEDYRKENKRLNILRLKTLETYGSESEKQNASQTLESIVDNRSSVNQYTCSTADVADSSQRRLECIQGAIDRLDRHHSGKEEERKSEIQKSDKTKTGDRYRRK